MMSPKRTAHLVSANSERVVVLDPIVPGAPGPAYCVHGRATCLACDNWCWLGDETARVVLSGDAAPLCGTCAQKYCEPTSLIGHIVDGRGHER